MPRPPLRHRRPVRPPSWIRLRLKSWDQIPDDLMRGEVHDFRTELHMAAGVWGVPGHEVIRIGMWWRPFVSVSERNPAMTQLSGNKKAFQRTGALLLIKDADYLPWPVRLEEFDLLHTEEVIGLLHMTIDFACRYYPLDTVKTHVQNKMWDTHYQQLPPLAKAGIYKKLAIEDKR